MKDNKDLKRNLDRSIDEMEAKGYLVPYDKSRRYRKVRPRVWRVAFELHPDHVRQSKRRTGAGKSPRASSRSTPAIDLVRSYHRHRFGRDNYQPARRERDHAETLLAQHDADFLQQLVPDVARRVGERSSDDLYFGFAVPFFHAAIDEAAGKQQAARRESVRRERQTAEQQALDDQRRERLQRRQSLVERWCSLSKTQQNRYRDLAIHKAATEIVRRRLRRCPTSEPPVEVLDAMAADQTLSP